MLRIKKLMATFLAMAMIFAMTAMPVSASMTYLYLTNANGTAYTTEVDTIGADLSVNKLGYDENYNWGTGNFSSSELTNVHWTWPSGGSNNFNYLETNTPVPGKTGEYYATLEIAAKTTATPGPYRVRATFNDGVNNPYIDLTIVVPDTNGQSKNVEVSVDGTNTAYGDIFNDVNTNVTATTGSYGYATPATALTGMQSTIYNNTSHIKSYIYDSDNDYVTSITGYDTSGNEKTKAEHKPTYRGWQFRVYHYNNGTYTIDPASETYSATAYKLTSGDYIKWYYGTYNEALNYFPPSF